MFIAGMSIAVRGNVRTAAAALIGLDPALRVAFNTGSVMGFMVVGFGLSGLSIMFLFLQAVSDEGKASSVRSTNCQPSTKP